MLIIRVKRTNVIIFLSYCKFTQYTHHFFSIFMIYSQNTPTLQNSKWGNFILYLYMPSTAQRRRFRMANHLDHPLA